MPLLRLPVARRIHLSRALYYPRKDSQDREELNPSRTEGTQSASDDAVAHESAAFDPNDTNPQSQKERTQPVWFGKRSESAGVLIYF
jgi:hypothetical protein